MKPWNSKNLSKFYPPLPDTPDSDLKQQNHLKVLRDEYAKLQKSYNELEQKYSRALVANPELNDVGGEFSSFLSRLAMQVANLQGRSVFSDIDIKLRDRTVPGHKFVLSARSNEWSESVIEDLKAIGEQEMTTELGRRVFIQLSLFQIGVTWRRKWARHCSVGSTQTSLICSTMPCRWAYSEQRTASACQA